LDRLPKKKNWTSKKKKYSYIGASKGHVNKFYTDIGLFNLLLIYFNIDWTLMFFIAFTRSTLSKKKRMDFNR